MTTLLESLQKYGVKWGQDCKVVNPNGDIWDIESLTDAELDSPTQGSGYGCAGDRIVKYDDQGYIQATLWMMAVELLKR